MGNTKNKQKKIKRKFLGNKHLPRSRVRRVDKLSTSPSTPCSSTSGKKIIIQESSDMQSTDYNLIIT